MTDLKADWPTPLEPRPPLRRADAAAAPRLGTLFNPGDYPATLVGLFGVRWDYPKIEPPDYLLALAGPLPAGARPGRSAFEEAVQLAEQAFLDEFARLVAHLTDGSPAPTRTARPRSSATRPSTTCATSSSGSGRSTSAATSSSTRWSHRPSAPSACGRPGLARRSVDPPGGRHPACSSSDHAGRHAHRSARPADLAVLSARGRADGSACPTRWHR